MTAPVSKVLSRGEFTELSNKGWSGGGLTHEQEQALDDHDEAQRSELVAMRGERESMLELIGELAEALRDENYYAQMADRTELLARAQALTSEKP